MKDIILSMQNTIFTFIILERPDNKDKFFIKITSVLMCDCFFRETFFVSQLHGRVIGESL